MKIYTLNLAANGNSTLDVEGEFLHIVESSSGQPFSVTIDGRAPITVERGLRLRIPGGFKQVVVENPYAWLLTVRIYVGTVEIDDYRPLSRRMLPNISATLVSGSIVPTTAATAQLLQGVSTTRHEVIAFAFVANLQYISLYTAQSASNLLCVIAPGQTFRLEYQGPIYAISSNGTDGASVTVTNY